MSSKKATTTTFTAEAPKATSTATGRPIFQNPLASANTSDEASAPSFKEVAAATKEARAARNQELREEGNRRSASAHSMRCQGFFAKQELDEHRIFNANLKKARILADISDELATALETQDVDLLVSLRKRHGKQGLLDGRALHLQAEADVQDLLAGWGL